ncbi:MAG: hypothetical protein E7B11_29135, partial [Clostridiales bacterium]|nr:hypothetical protein [Clostridiales bacterium]MDU3244614.1 hypothetical protein [Clostridiales bacterium]
IFTILQFEQKIGSNTHCIRSYYASFKNWLMPLTGIYDNAYFHKMFKSVKGMTPVQYKESL